MTTENTTKNQTLKLTLDVSSIYDYHIPTCRRCGLQVKDFFASIRECIYCHYKSTSQKSATIGGTLSSSSFEYLLMCIERVGGIDNLLEIVSSFSDDGVLFRKKGVLAGTLPGAFRWVKGGLGDDAVGKKSDMLLNYKASMPFGRKEFLDALCKFYTPESRAILHRRKKNNELVVKKGENNINIDKIIKSYLHCFTAKYGYAYGAFALGRISDEIVKELSEPMQEGIYESRSEDILLGNPIKISEIQTMLKFCVKKKLATDVTSAYTRKMKLIYDLPLELICDDLGYEK